MARQEKYGFRTDEQSLELYLKDITKTKYNPLSAEQEVAVAKKIKQGDQRAEKQLINANLRFVVKVAGNYQNQGLSLSDLVAEGNLGLIKAARRFDETTGNKFISYAVHWVRQSILQGIADNGKVVRVPVHKAGMIHTINKTREKLMQDYLRNPTAEEIAQELNISENEVTDLMSIGSHHSSLDSVGGDEDDGLALMGKIADGNIEDTDAVAMRNSTQFQMRKFLQEHLTERECMAITKYYGIGEETQFTLDEIGRQEGITRERVRQLKDCAINKIRRQPKLQKLLKAVME